MKAFPAVASALVQLKHDLLLERIPGTAAALLLLLLTIGNARHSIAQEMPRVQVFGGYSYARYDTPSFGFSSPTGLNGYTFSPAYNVIRGFGVVAELSGQYTTNRNLRDVAAGPQFLYLRTNLFNTTQDNLRFSTGLVYRWGTIKKTHRTLAPNP